MRSIYKYLFGAVAVAAVGLASCMYDDGIDNVLIVEGRPAQVELTFAVEDNIEVTTRAAQDEMYEHLVQNIYVFVFNGNKRVMPDKSFFDSTEITNYYNKVVDGNGQSQGTVTFGALSGSGLTVCAIANINISNTSVTRADIGEETQVDLDKLDKITTYSELQEMSIRLTSGNINRGASFMMTGEATANLQADETTEVDIDLERADSKITFNVKAQAPNNTYRNFKFIPNSFRVVNAPLKSYILPRVNDNAAGVTLTADMDATKVASDFYSIPEASAPKFEVVGDNSGSFTFYMYENLKMPKALINNNTNAGYALREKENKGEDGRNVDYIYAPNNATYVVLTGELSYSFDESYIDPDTKTETTLEKWLMADVEYVVHLGHSGVTNVDDYSTLRNHHYTYNVTIKGVNDLIVEVDRDNDPETDDQDNEQRPGAEGEIVKSAQRVINVDGHYDRDIIELTETEAQELHFAVNTPWESGYDTNGFNTQNNSTVRDYKWVKFLINREVGLANPATTFAAYPGDQCYDGGKTATGTAAQSAAYNNRTVTLRDIRQLSNFLRDSTNRKNMMTGDKIYITVFIDEYLYFYDPTADPMSTPASTNYKGVTNADAAGLLLWKKSVNQPDRMLHIVKAGEMKYSDDYETSISRSVVTIKQRAIQTFYNVGAENLKSAWGTETINETPRMTPANNKTIPNAAVNDNDYVRAQKLTSNGTPNWSAVISSTVQHGFGTNYNDPIYACAMRNRDFNGDGKINQQEVQWYLTSLNQMGDLWVGEPCMPSYARLFHLDDESGYDGTYNHHANGNTMGRHYITSYWKSSNSATSQKLYVYWAEEYGSNCAFDTSKGTYYGSPQYNREHVVSVRCVRNLGMAYTSTSMPTDYLQVVDSTPNNATDNEVSVDLSYMNIAALRQTIAATGHLPYVDMNEIGENNRPYFGFNVLPNYYGTGRNNTTTWYAAYQGEQVGGTSICPAGYRIPTQREMLIMVKALPAASWTNDDYGYLMYNGLTTQANKFGTFHYNYSNDEINMTTKNNMAASTDTAVTRCVKDNPNAKHSSSSDYEDGGEG